MAAPGRAGWLVAVVAVVALAYVTVNTLRTEGVGSRGLPAGALLPPAAVPLVASGFPDDADANVHPGPGRGPRGEPPACAVTAAGALNICRMARRRPVVLALVVAQDERCRDQLEVVDRVARRLPGIAFAAVAVRPDRAALRRLVRARGWSVKVGFDHDGVLASRFAMAVCPTFIFARRGGRVAQSTVGVLGARELAARAVALRPGAGQRSSSARASWSTAAGPRRLTRTWRSSPHARPGAT